MTETATGPEYISIARCARLYGLLQRSGRVDYSRTYGMIVNGELKAIRLAGRPCVIFASLPAEKQAQYLREEQERAS